MAKLRLLLMLLTFVVVGVFGTMTFLYAKGYRLNKGTITSNGLLIVKSVPDGAQITINGDTRGVTNQTISLSPGSYDIKVDKESFGEWKKRVQIEKGIVTEVSAYLYKSRLSLTSVTNYGVNNPTISPDMSKIAYIVNSSIDSANTGLWVLENINLPLGFSRDPKRITDGNLNNASFIWSPSGREIFLSVDGGGFLLDISKFTPQSQFVNMSASSKADLVNKWKKEYNDKLLQQFKTLPPELEKQMQEKVLYAVFSLDEDMVLFQAKEAFEIPNELIKPYPGASTQKQERNIKVGQTYIYDIKEDRCFLVDDNSGTQLFGVWNETPSLSKRSISWYPSSRHVILAEENKISIMDYDGTNRQVVYSGSFMSPYTFPTYSLDKILLVTNLGAGEEKANIYSLTIK